MQPWRSYTQPAFVIPPQLLPQNWQATSPTYFEFEWKD